MISVKTYFCIVLLGFFESGGLSLARLNPESLEAIGSKQHGAMVLDFVSFLSFFCGKSLALICCRCFLHEITGVAFL